MREELTTKLQKLSQGVFFFNKESLKLGRIKQLMKALGHPEEKVPAIHITGTSGKGSTAALLECLFRSSGYKTGLHISPFLQVVNEYVQINGKPLPDKQLEGPLEQLSRAIAQLESPPTYFECCVSLALLTFATFEVDIAIIETGLGGSLDATNILPAKVSILTNVGLDHTDILGDTIEKIAFDKAGIIKPNQTVISAASQASVIDIIAERCQQQTAVLKLNNTDFQFREHNNQIHFQYDQRKWFWPSFKLPGQFFWQNLSCALAAAVAMDLDIGTLNLQEILSSFQLPGRMEIVEAKPTIMLDGAHNQDKVAALLQALDQRSEQGTRIAVIAFKQDKDAVKLVPQFMRYFHKIILTQFTPRENRKAQEPQELLNNFPEFQNNMIVIDDPQLALNHARQLAKEDDFICVTGSLYLVGECRNIWFPKNNIAHA